MADDADKAQLLEQAMIERGIAAAKKKVVGQQIIDGGMVVCADCDAVILSERLRAVPDAVRCIDCQRDLEQRCRR